MQSHRKKGQREGSGTLPACSGTLCFSASAFKAAVHYCGVSVYFPNLINPGHPSYHCELPDETDASPFSLKVAGYRWRLFFTLLLCLLLEAKRMTAFSGECVVVVVQDLAFVWLQHSEVAGDSDQN